MMLQFQLYLTLFCLVVAVVMAETNVAENNQRFRSLYAEEPAATETTETRAFRSLYDLESFDADVADSDDFYNEFDH